MITVLHRGGYAQMITILHRGEGSLGTPKSDYVICARPLIIIALWNKSNGRYVIKDFGTLPLIFKVIKLLFYASNFYNRYKTSIIIKSPKNAKEGGTPPLH